MGLPFHQKGQDISVQKHAGAEAGSLTQTINRLRDATGRCPTAGGRCNLVGQCFMVTPLPTSSGALAVTRRPPGGRSGAARAARARLLTGLGNAQSGTLRNGLKPVVRSIFAQWQLWRNGQVLQTPLPALYCHSAHSQSLAELLTPRTPCRDGCHTHAIHMPDARWTDARRGGILRYKTA